MSDERQMPLEKPSEPVVDTSDTECAVVCMIVSNPQGITADSRRPWKKRVNDFIRAICDERNHLRAEVEALRGELAMVDSAFGNPLALDNCKTRYDKICKMFREIDTLSNSGIIEVAVRNMNVRHYMNHWEARTEKAETRAEASEASRAALVKYARHIEPCVGRYTAYREVPPNKLEPVIHECTCGLSAALAPPAQEVKP